MKNEGWICPRCGKVNAPWVPSCDCKPREGTISINIGDEPLNEIPNYPRVSDEGFDFGKMNSGDYYYDSNGVLCRLS